MHIRFCSLMVGAIALVSMVVGATCIGGNELASFSAAACLTKELSELVVPIIMKAGHKSLLMNSIIANHEKRPLQLCMLVVMFVIITCQVAVVCKAYFLYNCIVYMYVLI